MTYHDPPAVPSMPTGGPQHTIWAYCVYLLKCFPDNVKDRFVFLLFLTSLPLFVCFYSCYN